MSKRNTARETGINFLIGYGIGRIGRTIYDQNKMKRNQRELEKREVYRQVYGEEAYKNKYEPKYEQLVQPVIDEAYYKKIEYQDRKKNPFIAFVLSFFSIVFGYLYISPIYFGGAIIANVIMFNVVGAISGNMRTIELEIFTMVGGFLLIYVINVVATPILTVIYNTNVKKKNRERGMI